MNRLEETTPKIKSSSYDSGSSSSDSSSGSFMPSSPAFQTTPTDVSEKTSSMNILSGFDFKTLLILILLFVLLFSYLGINILTILGDSMERFVAFVSPMVTEFLVLTGYSTGSVINKTADVVSDTAKETIDIAEGAVQNVGNLLMDAGKKGKSKTPLLANKPTTTEPEPDAPENTIQKPISSTKYNWCLVGEYQNKRGCMPITESDKCLSGQVFPTQKMCLNPNLSQ
jgi:hypothetical protein